MIHLKNLENSIKIAVAGHAALDITPVFTNEAGQKLSALLRPGKLVNIGDAQISAGGVVSNTGLSVCALGAQAILMGKVGNDEFGTILKNIYVKNGCESHIVTTDEESTSYTIVLAPKGSDRTFLHNIGCNETFCARDVDFSQLKEVNHFHFGYPSIMRRFYEDDGDQLLELFKRVKEYPVTTSLDMSAIDPDAEAAKKDWEKIFVRVLPYVDFFVPSIEELGFILDKKRYDKWQRLAKDKDVTSILSLHEDVEALADKVLSLGGKTVLLKCGAAGMYLKAASHHFLPKWSGFAGFQDSFVPDRILSATGAGDTSIGAFIIAMLSGYTPGECLKIAAATGAMCVTAYDSVSGLLPLNELIEKINKGWKCVRTIRD